MLAGMYEVDNEEFNLIYPTFIKDFFFGQVWVGYSEELKLMEEESIKKEFSNRIDIQDALLNSNFRLYRRYVERNKLTKEETVK